MRIVHVGVGGVPVLHRFGGAVQRRIIEIARRQAAAGDDVIVYSVGESKSRVEHEGVEVRSLACRWRSRAAWIELQARAVADLRRERVDVLHFHNQPEGALIARGIKAPKFLTYDYYLFHGGRRSPLYPIYRRLLMAFDGLLPVSQYCLDESRVYWRLPADRMAVVHNGVDLDQFRPDDDLRRAERADLGIEGRVLLYLGRVCRQKGTDLLLDAFQALRLDHNDLRLVVAGPVGQFGRGEEGGDAWANRIREAGGLYLGAVAEERLAAVYNLADVFVMPTREHEMFGMAAVEAQACGKPVVASDHGGLRETVPIPCGARFRSGDALDLAAKLRGLLDDPEAHRLAAARALENASSFEWSRINNVLSGLYRRESTHACGTRGRSAGQHCHARAQQPGDPGRRHPVDPRADAQELGVVADR